MSKELQKYNYSNTEIAKEIFSSDGLGSIFTSISKVTKAVRKPLYNSAKITFKASTFIYAVPTYIRQLTVHDGERDSVSNFMGENGYGGYAGYMLNSVGVLAGATASVGQCIDYCLTADVNNLFWIPIATNVVSGVYEFGRHQVKIAKKRLTKKKKEFQPNNTKA